MMSEAPERSQSVAISGHEGGTLEIAKKKAERFVNAYVIRKKLVKIGATAERSPSSKPICATAQQSTIATRGSSPVREPYANGRRHG